MQTELSDKAVRQSSDKKVLRDYKLRWKGNVHEYRKLRTLTCRSRYAVRSYKALFIVKAVSPKLESPDKDIH